MRAEAPTAGSTTDLTPDRPSTRLSRAELFVIFAFWTFMALLTAVGGLLDPRGRSPQPVVASGPIAYAFLQYYIWALLTPLIFWLGARYGLERSNWGIRIALYLAIGILLAVFVDGVLAWLRLEFLTPMRRGFGGPGGGGRGGFGPGWSPWLGVRRVFFLDDLLIYAGVLAAAFARDYFLRYRARQQEAILLHAQAAELQAHAARLQAQLAEARLSALRTQIDPHFLFNTLNAVSTLVERDPRGVRRMIARLSELLRYSLERSAEQEVPLADEVRFLERYLEIMQIRFQGRLDIETRVSPDVLDALVPSLVLQPLVENAFKHGLGRLPPGTRGRIEIDARLDGDDVRLTVADNGVGLPRDALREGVGLRNTRARLEQLYGADQSLTLRPRADGGAVAEVTLPFHTRADLHTTGEIASVTDDR